MVARVRRRVLLRPADPQGARVDLGGPALPVHGGLAGRVGAARGRARGSTRQRARSRRRASLLALGGARRLAAAADLRPRPPRALLQHAARLQADLGDERRHLDPHGVRRRDRRVAPAGSSSASRTRGLGVPATAAAPSLGPVAVHLHRRARSRRPPCPSGTRRAATLPFVFAGSSLASAGGAAAALTGGDAAAPARALAVGGAALELAADAVDGAPPAPEGPRVLRRRRRPPPPPRRPGVHGRRRRAHAPPPHARRPAALALCAGSLLERVAVIRAGRVSAADPAQTVTPQKERSSPNA